MLEYFPDSTESEGTDLGQKESSLSVLKLSLIFQGQDSNCETHFCPNPLELSKKWFPVLKKEEIHIFKSYSKGLNTS